MKEMHDARAWVQHWFKKTNVSVRESTKRSSLLGTVYLDYIQTFKVHALTKAADGEKAGRPIPEREIMYALNEYIELTSQGELRTATQGLEFNGGTLEALKTWVTAVTGRADECDVAVIAHWMWLVKRKAIGKQVKHQIMPILYGPQGGGKTMALTSLIEPLSKFRLNLQMTSLADERVYEGFNANLIVLFDELQNIERTDLNVLKNQITTTFNTYRKLHTHSVINAPQNCSFIGATNKPINENFSDSTGMRRFYQLSALSTLDWAVINSFDYKNLWQNIDETSNDGYLTGDLLQAVQTRQQALVNPDELASFLDQNGLLPMPNGAGVTEIEASKLYTAYQEWCAKNGIKQLNSLWFHRKLINNSGLQTREERDNLGSRRRVYFINANAKIATEIKRGTDALTVIKFNNN